jgi:hypothetical protein
MVEGRTAQRPRGAMTLCCGRDDMGEAYSGGCTRGRQNGNVAAGAIDFLSLAAAPTFAIMALLTGAFDFGPPDTFCSVTQHASPLNGMVVMYLLMSAFHSAPWLRLNSSRRNGAHPAGSGVDLPAHQYSNGAPAALAACEPALSCAVRFERPRVSG